MSNQLINFLDNGATGFNRLVDFVKTLSGGDIEMTVAEVLIISRVLFAIVMVGFIGHFFDDANSLFELCSLDCSLNSSRSTANNDKEALALLSEFGLPFKNQAKKNN